MPATVAERHVPTYRIDYGHLGVMLFIALWCLGWWAGMAYVAYRVVTAK